MSTQAQRVGRWSTASFGETVDITSAESAALGDHLDVCRDARGRLFALRCDAASINGFVSARLVTTLVSAALVIGLVYLVV
jgi:hypothetical protein